MSDVNLQRRYARHISLDQVGLEGQKRLCQSKVLIVGAGGLGSPIALYLAAAGVGTIGLVDADVVSVSNLQRQILFSTTDEGQPKVEAAARRLRELNSECLVKTYNDFFTANNAETIAIEYDIVIDGSDNFATKFLVNDVCYKLQKPMVFGAVDQFEGQVALFAPRFTDLEGASGSSCYRCLYPEESKARIRNCAEAGVIGSLVGVIGTLQATLVLNWIISDGKKDHPLCPPEGRMTVMQLDSFDSFKYQIKKRTECPVCSQRPSNVQLHFQQSVCASLSELTWEQMPSLRQTNESLVIDVRELDEWEQGHLPGAVHWALSDLEKNEVDLSSVRGKTLFVYCQKGIRSLIALDHLASLSVPMYSIRGGLNLYHGELVVD